MSCHWFSLRRPATDLSGRWKRRETTDNTARGQEEGGKQREKPGPCGIVKPEWPAQMETSDVAEDEVAVSRWTEPGGSGLLWTGAAKLRAGFGD